MEANAPITFKVSENPRRILSRVDLWEVVGDYGRWVPVAFFVLKQDAITFAYRKNEDEKFKAKMRKQHIEEEAERTGKKPIAL